VNVSRAFQRLRGRDGTGEPDYPGTRLRVLSKGGELAAYLGYMRSRLRVARSTVFNLVATLIVLLALASFRTASAGGLAPNVFVAAVAFCTVLLLVSVWVARRISATYDTRLLQSDAVASSS
jgi:hypothetical protein